MKKDLETRRRHYAAAMVGGFFGGFAVLMHHNLVASAQTSNLINLVKSILGRDILQTLLHLASLALYMLALALTLIIPRYTKWSLHWCSFVITGFTTIIISLIPPSIDDFVALYPIFFAMAFQWNSYPGADGYACSSIFSTNNVRQFTTSFVEFLLDKEHKHLHKTSFYGGTLLAFHAGVAISYLGCKNYGQMGGLFAFIPLSISCVFLIRESYFLRQKTKI